MNINTLLVVFAILAGIDTSFELIKKFVSIIKWVIGAIQNVGMKIHNARKK